MDADDIIERIAETCSALLRGWAIILAIGVFVLTLGHYTVEER